MNTAFVIRLTWDSTSRSWLILLKPIDGAKPRVFADLEMAFLYIARLYTDHERAEGNPSILLEQAREA
jgi:hypothetical protein